MKPNSQLQEARFLKFRSAANLGRNFMRRNMKRSVIFGAAARRALHNRKDYKSAKRVKYGRDSKFVYPGLKVNAQRDITSTIDRQNKEFARMERMGKKLAPVVGGVMLGAAVAGKTYRFAKKVRSMSQQPTQFRSYDVYPEHGYAAVGIQPYNRPYYNDPNRSGAPRHSEPRVGVYEREAIIDKIVEALS